MSDQPTTAIDDLFLDDHDDAPETPTKGPRSRRWTVLAIIAGIAAVGAVGFAVGRATADDAGAATGDLPAGFTPPTGDSGPAIRPGGGGFVAGELAAIDGDEWLITDNSGNTVRVKVSDATTYRKTETVTEDDVAIGDQVTVIGDEEDDGTVDAATVQSGDAGFGGGVPAGGPPAGDDSTTDSTPTVGG